jgi:transcriptional regulator with AAA-type ATPase domain
LADSSAEVDADNVTLTVPALAERMSVDIGYVVLVFFSLVAAEKTVPFGIEYALPEDLRDILNRSVSPFHNVKELNAGLLIFAPQP